MEFTVSQKIQAAFDAAVNNEKVRRASEFLVEEFPFSMEEHRSFVACESPTFHEQKRGEMFAEKLREYGITDVQGDEYGNVFGWRRGTGGGPTLLVEAHMDTVFPFGSVREMRDEDEKLYAPGASDNTRGVSALLAAIRALNSAGIETKGDIIFCGTSREEGMGSLGGMRDFLAHGPKVDASISVDGGATEEICCEATGYKTAEVTFYGKGGHAYVAFGEVANPLHAAARAVAKIADFEVPSDPKTTFCVSNFHAGNDAGIHAIVPQASIKFNIRSTSQEILDELEKRVYAAVQEACDEETARWGRDTITWDSRQFCDVPAGTQDHHMPMIEAAWLAANYYTAPEYRWNIGILQGGCVNGNMAIKAGIPCITIGNGHTNRRIHSLEEYFDYHEGWRLPQEIVTLICMTAGVEGMVETILGAGA